MRINDYCDLIQLGDGEYNPTYGIDSPSINYVAKNVPVNFTSMRDDNKTLQNRDTEWHERYIVQHKILQLSEVVIDAVYRHSDQTYYMVNWRNSTGTPKIVSYRVELKDVRRTEWEGEPFYALGGN